ncbi:hypothetical protein B0A48_05752 [Cryoendolithus antarcticus]|uniref:DH domain-containing protein n=1 Tax=Cryoendolithus antarcticus TaxID=1507870 RepID=A0A1V8TCD5_9PEZI|nr:hypothetical protein B0A48_05752 [Cryoendolithus antarcticus]
MSDPAPYDPSSRARDTSAPSTIAGAANGVTIDDAAYYLSAPPARQQQTTLDPALRAAREAFSPAMASTSGEMVTVPYRPFPSTGKLRSASGPASSRSLNTAKSQPVLLASRAPGSVKDIASKFNERAVSGSQAPALTVRTSDTRYHRDIGKSKTPSSPTKTTNGITKLQKRRPGQPPSPRKSASSSVDGNSSFKSTSTTLSAKSQPHAAFSPKKAKPVEQQLTKPLFGEITSDGRWNGNFDMDLGSYGSLPTLQPASRRASDGTISLGHGRSQSQQDLHPGFTNTLSHKRSRSDMDTSYRPVPAPSMPNLQNVVSRSAHSGAFDHTHSTQSKSASASHSPVRYGRRGCSDYSASASRAQSRARSAVPNGAGRNKLAKSPTRVQHEHVSASNSKAPVAQNRRYSPPNLPSNNQTLSAKIITPLPKTSPPLRSSRPRQPVSAATTAASRARAAGVRSPTKQRPSEQWLGKPYDAQQERKKRDIPELRKVDFAARRERIQKAMSRNMEEQHSGDSSRSASRSSHARSQSRQPSSEQSELDGNEEIPHSRVHDSVLAEDEGVNVADQHAAEEFEREIAMVMDGGQGATPAGEEQKDLHMGRFRTLSIDTHARPAAHADLEPEPNTAGTDHTVFDIDADESPVLGHLAESSKVRAATDDIASLPDGASNIAPPLERQTTLTSATYMPGDRASGPLLSAAKYMSPVKVTTPAEDAPPLVADVPSRNSMYDNVMLLRQSSATSSLSAEATASTPFTGSSASLANGWNTDNDQGSIRIMLDNEPTLQPTKYVVTPDTPPDAAITAGSAVVFAPGAFDGPASLGDELADGLMIRPTISTEAAIHLSDPNNVKLAAASEEDFAAQIRKANEEWERQQRGEETVLGAVDDSQPPPPPPPKDAGYTPRSSVGPGNASLHPSLISEGLRISTSGDLDLAAIQVAGHLPVVSAPQSQVSSPIRAPPQPVYAPPPPPPMPHTIPEVPQIPATYSERGSSELSPKLRRNIWGPSPDSSRPSIDSQRLPVPASASMSSFGESTRVGSGDVNAEGPIKLNTTASTGPEQKRLQKRRHIIMELLNTENSYHQDLKIIEDIYKGTAEDFISAEDKKILFGNCDEIEKFSLQFFDSLRKAIAPAYAAPKNLRRGGNRGSMSTTQSDATGSIAYSMDSVDDEKDKSTTIGQCFVDNLTTMETIYGAYLKNHDAANQRLSALQTNPVVKCWLDECHNNANDITSAWDLDSLLVKPTQRVAKYPLMLQQLLESTPLEHPDHDALKIAASSSIAMLTRINDAKKRAELVEQMIGRKGKDTDVRTGLAKAFGRKTEKIKERMGVSEAYQDIEFDALAHKFGGHYIRLQICMRDVQDYVNRTDKAVQQIGAFAAALEFFGDSEISTMQEITSKWRRYALTVRDLTGLALSEHKAVIHKRVITPMIAVIKLHQNPQDLIAKRKKRIVDYARVQAMEKKGEKPTKKEIEAAEMYEALNHQLKLELPILYELTGTLVRNCQLRPLIEDGPVPDDLNAIAPAFQADYEIMRTRVQELGIINGATLAESANFLSPTTTLVGDSEYNAHNRPSISTGSKRTMSMGSEGPSVMQTPSSSKRQSGYNTPDTAAMDLALLPNASRMRSNSSMSSRQMPMAPVSTTSNSANRPWSRSTTSVSYSGTTPTSSFTGTRPSTASHAMQQLPYLPRASIDTQQSARPASQQTYFTARPEMSADPNNHRFSGIFTSALPPEDDAAAELPMNSTDSPTSDLTPVSARPMSPTTSAIRSAANDATRTLFVCASLFEFNIDKSRKEGGYPYLTYVQGEVFDVVAQKGELWLAKNQDDAGNSLGWIWEQHFVILSQD